LCARARASRRPGAAGGPRIRAEECKRGRRERDTGKRRRARDGKRALHLSFCADTHTIARFEAMVPTWCSCPREGRRPLTLVLLAVAALAPALAPPALAIDLSRLYGHVNTKRNGECRSSTPPRPPGAAERGLRRTPCHTVPLSWRQSIPGTFHPRTLPRGARGPPAPTGSHLCPQEVEGLAPRGVVHGERESPVSPRRAPLAPPVLTLPGRDRRDLARTRPLDQGTTQKEKHTKPAMDSDGRHV
jgi:hypothetical protein